MHLALVLRSARIDLADLCRQLGWAQGDTLSVLRAGPEAPSAESVQWSSHQANQNGLRAAIALRHAELPIDALMTEEPTDLTNLHDLLDELLIPGFRVAEASSRDALHAGIQTSRQLHLTPLRAGKPASTATIRTSVVIPAYNVEPYLEKAIQSIQQQTLAPDEILVADDASTDRTAEIARAMGATVLSGPKGNGSVARNRGARAATGELLLFLDGDDWWHPWKVEAYVAAYLAHPDNGLFCDVAHAVEANRVIPRRFGNLGGEVVDWSHFLDWRAPPSGSGFGIARSRYLEMGGFHEELVALQDVDFFVRAAHAYGGARRIPLGLTFYRILPRSVSKTPKRVQENLAKVLAGWPFIDSRRRAAFTRQTYLTAARWCNLRSGIQYLRLANWPMHDLKFWKVAANMVINSLRETGRPRP